MQSLDAFPLEYGEILRAHDTVLGRTSWPASRSRRTTCGGRARPRSKSHLFTCARHTWSRAATRRPSAELVQRVGAGVRGAAAERGAAFRRQFLQQNGSDPGGRPQSPVFPSASWPTCSRSNARRDSADRPGAPLSRIPRRRRTAARDRRHAGGRARSAAPMSNLAVSAGWWLAGPGRSAWRPWRRRSRRRPELTKPVNDFAGVIDAESAAAIDAADSLAAAGERRRRRGRDDRHLPALRHHPGIRRQDVRERRPRHRPAWQGQRRPRAPGREGPSGTGRSRATTSNSSSPTASLVRSVARYMAPAFAQGRYGPGLARWCPTDRRENRAGPQRHPARRPATAGTATTRYAAADSAADGSSSCSSSSSSSVACVAAAGAVDGAGRGAAGAAASARSAAASAAADLAEAASAAAADSAAALAGLAAAAAAAVVAAPGGDAISTCASR